MREEIKQENSNKCSFFDRENGLVGYELKYSLFYAILYNRVEALQRKAEILSTKGFWTGISIMKLGIVSYAPNFISQCLSLNAHKA